MTAMQIKTAQSSISSYKTFLKLAIARGDELSITICEKKIKFFEDEILRS
jgi:hypothetical protein